MILPRRVALDTSAYAHMRAGNTEIMQIVAESEVVYLPTIVLGELEAGFRLGRRMHENRTMLAEFLREPFTAVLPVTSDVALVYGELFAELRAAGTPIAVNDIWIAAATLQAGAHLATFDRDFDLIVRLSRTVLSA